MISMKNDAHKLTLKEIAKRINSEMDSLVESKRTRFSEETVLFECVMNPAPSVGFSVTCDYVIDLCSNALQRNNCPEELKPQLEKCKAYAVRMQNEGLYSKDEYKLFHKILKEKSLVVVPADKIKPGQPLLRKLSDAEIRSELGQLDFVGKQVLKSNGQLFTVTEFRNKTYLVLDDGKNGYDALIALNGRFLSFVDKEFQASIDKLLEPRQIYYAPMPPDPPKVDILPPPPPPPVLPMDVLAEAIALLKRKGEAYPEPRIIFASNAKNFEKLKAGKIYGTVAEEIYGQCCHALEFKWEYKWLFGKRQLLFATQATREGYSVWMLPHSTYTGTSCGHWSNVMRDAGRTIHEVWFVRHEKHSAPRVTFVKQADRKYVFMGVYEFAGEQAVNREIDGVYTYCIRTYKQIGTEYYL